ncbi:MAG: hypothetical protein HY904_21535 [Deltaproteobacteria bacterium]|nr:hypothetical protein [Deltaproteobacteria bacterium]
MPAPVNQHLRIFTATRADEVPPGITRYIAVDGTVPGFALRYDHHVTGEAINLDALPPIVDGTGYDGLCTTQADADAMASMVAVLLGGKTRVPAPALAVLESASHWCDHLLPHAAHDADINRAGRGLLRAFQVALGDHRTPDTSAPMHAFCHDVAARILAGAALPSAPEDEQSLARARAVLSAGRVSMHGRVALVDLRGTERLSTEAIYRAHGGHVGVVYGDHEHGGLRYTVGINPFVDGAPRDVRPALHAIAAAEFRHGPPVRAPEAVPGNENWGGRAVVFGSPFNHGSRLTPLEVVALVLEALPELRGG